MDASDRLTIARILKVNHAGEYGAIRIYRAQMRIARRRFPEIVAFLEETLGHEVSHCSQFLEAMPQRGARPCRMMGFWGVGGSALGLLTALIGRRGIWICTAAVEAAVHRHLDDQLYFLRERDRKLHSMIAAIQQEELNHLRHAQARLAAGTPWLRLLGAAISKATDVAIWLSTSGDSAAMAKALAAARSR